MSNTYRQPIQITVANKLAVLKAQLPTKAKQFLREKLFILNSEYIIKEAWESRYTILQNSSTYWKKSRPISYCRKDS